MKYEQIASKSVTMYPAHWEKVRRLADERHEGNISRALRQMVDEFDGNEEADDASSQ